MTESAEEQAARLKRIRVRLQRAGLDDGYSRQRFVDDKLEELLQSRDGDQLDE